MVTNKSNKSIEDFYDEKITQLLLKDINEHLSKWRHLFVYRWDDHQNDQNVNFPQFDL